MVYNPHKFLDIDSILNQLMLIGDNNGYPYYNVIKDNKDFIIEMAVAGFSKQDLKVSHENNTLVISGEVSNKAEENTVYLTKGISTKSFSRRFTLNKDKFKITEVRYTDGVLRINIESINSEPDRLTYEIL